MHASSGPDYGKHSVLILIMISDITWNRIGDDMELRLPFSGTRGIEFQARLGDQIGKSDKV